MTLKNIIGKFQPKILRNEGAVAFLEVWDVKMFEMRYVYFCKFLSFFGHKIHI